MVSQRGSQINWHIKTIEGTMTSSQYLGIATVKALFPLQWVAS